MPKKDPKDLKYGITKTENKNAYTAAQVRSLYYRPAVYINKETYADVVEHLKAQPSVSEYIVSLIVADMEKNK